MKQPSFFADATLFQKSSLFFSLLTLLCGGILYLIAAVAWPVLITLLLFNIAVSLLLYYGSQKKALRIIGRVLLLAPTSLAVLTLLVYLILLWTNGYTVSLPELALLVSLVIGSTVLFATPTLAFLSLRNSAFEQIAFRIAAAVSLVLALFTVLCTLTLKTGADDYLLVVLMREPLLYALFVACALATAVTAAEPLFNRAEQPNKKRFPFLTKFRKKNRPPKPR